MRTLSRESEAMGDEEERETGGRRCRMTYGIQPNNSPIRKNALVSTVGICC